MQLLISILMMNLHSASSAHAATTLATHNATLSNQLLGTRFETTMTPRTTSLIHPHPFHFPKPSSDAAGALLANATAPAPLTDIVGVKVRNVSGIYRDGVSVADGVVFSALESLALCAIVGNALLLVVIGRWKYLEKPSFNLIASMALADIGHGLVCATYFYPPIVGLGEEPRELRTRIMNTVDWVTWGVTITHMAAIGIDRFLAIHLLQGYSRVVSKLRARVFTLSAWLFFASVNVPFAIAQVCCPVVPVPEMYTFDYAAEVAGLNVYPYIYIPLELFQSRDLRIFLQIALVTFIFTAYMGIYYLMFYVARLESKWVTLLNSCLYSVTHMVNPVVYFSLNADMRTQLLVLLGRATEDSTPVSKKVLPSHPSLSSLTKALSAFVLLT